MTVRCSWFEGDGKEKSPTSKGYHVTFHYLKTQPRIQKTVCAGHTFIFLAVGKRWSLFATETVQFSTYLNGGEETGAKRTQKPRRSLKPRRQHLLWKLWEKKEHVAFWARACYTLCQNQMSANGSSRPQSPASETSPAEDWKSWEYRPSTLGKTFGKTINTILPKVCKHLNTLHGC